MKVYWLEQNEADMATTATAEGGTWRALEWLSARERFQLDAMRFAQRRADWRLGRWTTKLAVAACLQLPLDLKSLAQIEVRAAPSGAPEAYLENERAPVTISLSHRSGRAACALVLSSAALGCDLETIEPHSDAFVSDFFTLEEQELAAQTKQDERPLLISLLWSAKESALKALHEGLRLDTRSITVAPIDALDLGEDKEPGWQENSTGSMGRSGSLPDSLQSWRQLRVTHVNGQNFLGWWQHSANLVRTIVAAPPPAAPIRLQVHRCSVHRSPLMRPSEAA